MSLSCLFSHSNRVQIKKDLSEKMILRQTKLSFCQIPLDYGKIPHIPWGKADEFRTKLIRIYINWIKFAAENLQHHGLIPLFKISESQVNFSCWFFKGLLMSSLRFSFKLSLRSKINSQKLFSLKITSWSRSNVLMWFNNLIHLIENANEYRISKNYMVVITTLNLKNTKIEV